MLITPSHPLLINIPMRGVKEMYANDQNTKPTCGTCSNPIPPEDVAHQHHYEDQGEQPIEYMEASMPRDQFVGFLKGNIIKYVSRFEKKDGIKDLEKAKVYTTWLIEYIKDGKIKVRE